MIATRGVQWGGTGSMTTRTRGGLGPPTTGAPHSPPSPQTHPALTPPHNSPQINLPSSIDAFPALTASKSQAKYSQAGFIWAGSPAHRSRHIFDTCSSPASSTSLGYPFMHSTEILSSAEHVFSMVWTCSSDHTPSSQDIYLGSISKNNTPARLTPANGHARVC